MGSKIAGRLHQVGHQLFVHSLCKSEVENTPLSSVPFIDNFAEEIHSIQPELIFTCLPTSQEVREVVSLYLKGVPPRVATSTSSVSSYWIDCTSGEPTSTREFAQNLKEAGVPFLDVGVSGGPKNAAAGALTAMVGGDAQTIHIIWPVLSSFASKIVHIGEVGSGHAVKSICNSLLATNLWAAAEGLVTLTKFGVDPVKALDAINNSSGRSWVTLGRIPDHVLTRTFNYGFSLGLLQKDINTTLNMAATHAVPTPLLQSTRTYYSRASSLLSPNVDHLEPIRLIEQWGGQTIESSANLIPRRTSFSSPNLYTLGLDLIVFDCAGTVVDEGALVYQTLIKVLESDNVPVDLHEFDAWHGANKVEAIRHFVTKHESKENESRVQALYAQFVSSIDAAYFNPNSSIKVMDGAIPILDAIRATGIKVALNTGYPRNIADKLIETLQLSPHIDGSIVAEEVGFGRPYPYMIHSLMKKFQVVDTRRVAKVGDTVRDIEEGKNAGCSLVIGVLSGADGAAPLSAAGADLILNSVADIVCFKP